MSAVFVAGTGTNVGKTVVAAACLRAIPGARYWKPVQTGDDDDTLAVTSLAQLPAERYLAPRYRFRAPRSPHLAASLEETEILNEALNTAFVVANRTPGALVVEGAGGLLVPLNRTSLQIDQIGEWQLPILLVAHDRLGAINETLLSLEACRRRDLRVIGVVLNRHTEDFGNEEAIRQYGKVDTVVMNEHTSADQSVGLLASLGAFGEMLGKLL